MNTSYERKHFQKRIKIADEIITLHQATGMIDAELILCCVISGLAAKMWPGTGKDKFRFIQFLVQFAPTEINIQTVSLYYLIGRLRKTNPADADKLIDSFFSSRREYDGKIFLDDESLPVSLLLKRVNDASTIDQTEEAILSVASDISLKDLRQASYAAIIYTELRSYLVHQYMISDQIASSGPANNIVMPSYANIIRPPDEGEVQRVSIEQGVSLDEVRASLATTHRHLFFPYEYIRKVAVGVAEAAFRYWDRANAGTSTPPVDSDWWINGGEIA